MDHDQEKKATNKSVSPGTSDDVQTVEQAGTQMQRLMIGDGSDESQIEGGNDRAQIANNSNTDSTTPTEPNPRNAVSGRPSVGQGNEEAATAEPSVVSEASAEADDTLPDLISQEDEAADEVDDFSSIVESDGQVEDFQDTQQYPRGGPLDIDPSDRRLDYKELAQKGKMETEELRIEVEELKERIRKLEGNGPRVEEDEKSEQLRARNRGLQEEVEDLQGRLEDADTRYAIEISQREQGYEENQNWMLQNAIRDLEEKLRQEQAKNRAGVGASAHGIDQDFMCDDEDEQQDLGTANDTEDNAGGNENETNDDDGQGERKEDVEDNPEADAE
ncbi:hypothetical protein G7Y79_00021g050380 [Physcia stellaris]|nr:hypothetical protein G7Y79_00021g050380 [Physcia stellaris]